MSPTSPPPTLFGFAATAINPFVRSLVGESGGGTGAIDFACGVGDGWEVTFVGFSARITTAAPTAEAATSTRATPANTVRSWRLRRRLAVTRRNMRLPAKD